MTNIALSTETGKQLSKFIVWEKKMKNVNDKKSLDPFLKSAALALQHLRRSGRVWVQNENEMWSSIPFHEFSWLQRFPEDSQKEILKLAGAASSRVVGIRQPDERVAA